MRLGLLTACYKRPDITRLVLDYYTGLRVAGVEFERLAVISDEVAPESEGWTYLRHANRPLGAKWNAGLRAMQGLGVDAVMTTGSDDLISADYMKIACGYVGDHLVAPMGIHLYDMESDQLMYLPNFAPGTGRMYSSALLDWADWTLWNPAREIGLDTNAMRKAIKYANKPRTVLGTVTPGGGLQPYAILGLKSGENLWTFEENVTMAGGGETIPDPDRWMQEQFGLSRLRDGGAGVTFDLLRYM